MLFQGRFVSLIGEEVIEKDCRGCVNDFWVNRVEAEDAEVKKALTLLGTLNEVLP
jgi:hypothetical protein